MADVPDESYWCEEVFEMFEFSVVRLHTEAAGFRGNGFIVHAKDMTLNILTCHHVVDPVPVGGTMAAYFSGNVDPYDAKVIYADEGRDLALLRALDVLPPGPMKPLRFFEEPFVSGWTVVALSFITMGEAAILEPGTFSGQITNGPGDAYLNCSCSSKDGASGSPIILAGVNEVVAVLAGASLASVYAIPVTTIREFLCGWLDIAVDIPLATNGIVALAALKE